MTNNKLKYKNILEEKVIKIYKKFVEKLKKKEKFRKEKI